MSRFLAWLRWEWRSHAKMLVASACGALIVIWAAVLITARGLGTPRAAVEGIEVALFAVLGLVLGAGLFGSERRSSAAALVLRLPGARGPLLAARLTFFAMALGALALFMAFAAARIFETHVHAGDGVARRPEMGLFLWPRWIMADVAVLGLALAGFGALASAWTRRVTFATVIGLFLPAVLAFPLIYLSFKRSDFYDLRRWGAIPLAAWPLLGLALLALAASWLAGQRFLNRTRRAVGFGALVLIVGCGIAAAWTASAFATFDSLDPADPGFRLVTWQSRHSLPHTLGRVHSVALSESGRYLYVHGLRVDRGTWPEAVDDVYGSDARDFRADRGTWSKPIGIDLQSGDVTVLGGVRAGLGWVDLGRPGQGVWPSAWSNYGRSQDGMLSPRSHAWLWNAVGENGMGLLALDRPHDRLAMHADMSDSAADAASRALGASASGVHDAGGRSVWLSFPTNGKPWRRHRGERAVTVQIVHETGAHRSVKLPPIHWPSSPGWSTWLGHGDGWSLRYHPKMVLTLEASSGVARTTTREQLQAAGPTHPYGVGTFVLSSRHVLVALAHIEGSPWHYRVLDLETHGVGPVLEGPDAKDMVPRVLPGGRLLCRVGEEGVERFELWDPLADTRTPVTAPGALLGGRLKRVYAALVGSDRRGNFVLSITRQPAASPTSLTVQTVLFRAATTELVPLEEMRAAPLGAGFAAVGIDLQDRVVGLDGFDGHGYLRVVRVDPRDGSRTVLFPREVGPKK